MDGTPDFRGEPEEAVGGCSAGECRGALGKGFPSGRLAAVLVVLAALPGPGIAQPGARVGASSSARVEIAVSVAPRFSVAAAQADPQGTKRSGLLCLATNGPAPATPVLLVPASSVGGGAQGAAPPRDGRAIPLLPCAAADRSASDALRVLGAAGGRTMLVRPE